MSTHRKAQQLQSPSRLRIRETCCAGCGVLVPMVEAKRRHIARVGAVDWCSSCAADLDVIEAGFNRLVSRAEARA